MGWVLDEVMDYIRSWVQEIICFFLEITLYWGELLWTTLYIPELATAVSSETFQWFINLLWTLNQWFPVSLAFALIGYLLMNKVMRVAFGFLWSAVRLGG